MGTPLRALLETSTASIRSWAPPCPQPPRAQPSLRFRLAQLPPARSGCCHQRVAQLVPGVPGWGTAPGGLVQGERCWAQPWGSSAGHQGQVWRMPEALAPSPGGTKKGPCWGRWHGEGGRGWLWPPGQPLPQPCPGAAAGRCCTKRVLGAAPCGLPLLTAAPARAAPGTFPPSTQNLHWEKKKSSPPNCPSPSSWCSALQPQSSPALQGGDDPWGSTGVGQSTQSPSSCCQNTGPVCNACIEIQKYLLLFSFL